MPLEYKNNPDEKGFNEDMKEMWEFFIKVLRLSYKKIIVVAIVG